MTMQNPHYDQNGRPLVPQAERAFIPVHELESVSETVWFNPTEKDCVLDLYIGVTPCHSEIARAKFRALPAMQKKEFRTGIRRYIIRAGERRAIHSDFDQGIQQVHCQEPDCSSPQRMYCKDPTHHKMVIGGLGPQLINERVQHRPSVHPSLLEAAAMEKEALQRAQEFMNQKAAADAALLVAQAEAEKARALKDKQAAADERAAHVANPSPTAPSATGQKKDK